MKHTRTSGRYQGASFGLLGATLATCWSTTASAAGTAPDSIHPTSVTPVPVEGPPTGEPPAHPAAQDAPPATTTPSEADPKQEPTKESQEQDAAKKPPKDPADDGSFDISDFLDQKFGFLPIVRPITEPAVGFGAAGGLMFLSKPLGAAANGLGRPSITGVGGFGTANGSWGAFGMDMRYWAKDHVQTTVAVIGASVNLDYYGTGDDSVLHENPLRYNLQPLGGVVKAKYRFGDTRLWAGLGYSFVSTEVTFAAPDGTTGIPDYQSRTNVGMLMPYVTFDNRDTMFTPTRGTFLEANLDAGVQALGSDADFQRILLTGIQYVPLPHQLYLGVRGDFGISLGTTPFYMRPSIDLRGVSAMRYQGEEVLQVELELRWQFYKRWSVLAFSGGGGAWNHLEQVDNFQGIVAGGGGFRYELARKYGIHAGVDVAGSKDTAAVYLQVGSAWMRP